MAKMPPLPAHLAGPQAPCLIASAPTQLSHTTPGPASPYDPRGVAVIPAPRPPPPPATSPLQQRPPPAAFPLQQRAPPATSPLQQRAPPASSPMQQRPPPAAGAAPGVVQPAAPAVQQAAAAAAKPPAATPAAGWAAAPEKSPPSFTPGNLTPGTPTPPPKPKRSSQQATSIKIDQVDAPGLLDYGIHLLTRSGLSVPTEGAQKRRGRSFDCYNACVSPVHVVAGWAVAGLSADTKTREFIEKMIETKALDLVVTKKGAEEGTLHPTIGLLLFELGFPSFVRLYFEPQFAIPQIVSVVDEINNAFGDEDFPAIKPLCFSCDDSGDATARKINHDVLTFTNKRVATVIDSNANLNRLAQACVVSAFACTFSWALRSPTGGVSSLAHFYSTNEKKKKYMSKVRCLTDTGPYRFSTSDQYDCIELGSLLAGEACYLIRPKNQSISDWIASANGGLIDGIIADLHEKPKPITVSVPLFTVETPMRLGEAASTARGRYSLWRLFDTEKCKLTRMFYKNSDDSLCTLPLWDHYHQTVFELSNKLYGAVNSPADNDSLPKTDIDMLDFFDRSNPKPAVPRMGGGVEKKEAKLVYHKLEDCTQGVWAEEPRPPPPRNEGETSDMHGKLSFDTPFLFLVRKTIGKKSALPVAVGIFTNADTDPRKDTPVE